MPLPLQEICNAFSKEQDISLRRDHQNNYFTGEKGPYFVEYHANKGFEVLSVLRSGECHIEAMADTQDKVLITKIAYGCLPDYVALLKRSPEAYARVIGTRYEKKLVSLGEASPAPTHFLMEEFPLVPKRFLEVLETIFPWRERRYGL